MASCQLGDDEMKTLLTLGRHGEMPTSWPVEEMQSGMKMQREEMGKHGL